VNTANCWEHAETWGTDKHTYPSENVYGEETLEKRTDVWGNCPDRKNVLGDLKHGPGVQLIRISRRPQVSSAIIHSQYLSGMSWPSMLRSIK